MNNLNLMESVAELDCFEPLTRARSNTWPLPRPENFVDPADAASNKCSVLPAPSTIPAKKNSSRRNAWGNLSYADLITQAITSAPEKRLTLSQIYEWMVHNVPYFKDKGDSNSSAGWKNSIRHNLSLHNRFMRVQNEGTGKSSWWMINPDAKPGKSVRRRAASMETSKFEKRRGRVKKKVEALRNGLPDATSSPSSSVSEGLDMFPDSPLHSAGGFQLSPDFRPRASSNTSSCGRLSPIPAVVGLEPDWGSPSQYNRPNYSPEMAGSYSPDNLAGNLQQRMKIEPDYLGYLNGQSPQPAPPPSYTSAFEPFNRREVNTLPNSAGYTIQCPIHRFATCSCPPVQCKIERMSPPPCMSPSYPHSNPSPEPLSSHQFVLSNRIPLPVRPSSHSPPITQQLTHNTQQGPQSTPSTMMGQLMGALNSSTLLDDLNINIESLHGGFDCNVDEVIKHELSMEGSLDFNFTGAHHQSITPHQQEASNPTTSAPPPYSRSWVH